jgi:glycine hydroxymethyltransferase
VTSGIRMGTPAITTRGVKEEHMTIIADLVDTSLMNRENTVILGEVKKKVNELMNSFPLFQF